MTIKEVIMKAELEQCKTRMDGLKELGAPSVILTSLENTIKSMEEGQDLKVGGNKELLDVEYVNVETKKGNGGNLYYSFNNGTINYFPKAKYGKCIYKAEKESKSVKHEPILKYL